METLTDRDTLSTGQLLRELSRETSKLLRQEVDLAKAEMSEKVAKASRHAAYLAIGGFVAYAGFLALVATAIIALTEGLGRATGLWVAMWLSPLIIGVVVAIIGYVLIRKAVATFQSETIVPEKTVDTMRENKEWLEHKMA